MEDFNNISYSNDFPIEQIPVIRSYLIKEKKSQQERFLNLQTHLKDRLKQITLRLEDKSPPTSTQDGNRMIQQQSENLEKIQEIFKHQDTQLTSEIQKNEKLIQQLTNELKTISPLVNARTGNANQNSDMIQTFEETRKVVATILNSSLNGLYNQLATVDDIGNVSASLDSNRSSLDSEASSYLFSRRSERSKSKTRLDDWEENSFLLKKSSLVEEELKKSVMEQLFSLLRQLNVINIESIQTPSEGFLKLSQKIDQLLEERKGFSPNTVITSKEVESLKGQIQKLSAIVTKQRDQISELQNKNPSSSSPYRSLYDEEASLKENITRNQHELQLLTLDFEKLKHDKSSIQSELAVLEDKLTKKRKEVADYEKQSQESVKQFLSLQKEIDEKKKLLEELNKELNSKPEKTNRSSINLEDEKNTELQTQKKVLAQLKQEEYKLIQEKCRLEAELIALEKTIQKYKEEEVRLEKKKQQMITYIEELRSSAQQLSQTNAHLLQVNKGLEKIRNEIQQERNGLVVFIQEKQQMILHLSREINRLKNSSGVSGGSKRNLLQDYTSPSNSSALSNILSQLQNEEVMLDESLAHLKSVENRMSYFDQDRRDTETSSKDLSKYVNMNSNSSSTQIQIEKKKFERLLELIKSKDELFQNVYIEVSVKKKKIFCSFISFFSVLTYFQKF